MEMRKDHKESGMTMREQARLAMQVLDKAVPSKQAIKHSGDPDNPIIINMSKDDESL